MPFSTNRPITPSVKNEVSVTRGWTLAELMIALAVMSVLATLALPSYLQQQRTARRSLFTGITVSF